MTARRKILGKIAQELRGLGVRRTIEAVDVYDKQIGKNA